MAWRNLTPPAPPPPFPEPHRAGESSSEGTDPNTTAACAHICVLASGSSGNCTVLRTITASGRPDRTALLDAGLSPTRTRRLLADRGIALSEIDDIVEEEMATVASQRWMIADARSTLAILRRRRIRSNLMILTGPPMIPYAVSRSNGKIVDTSSVNHPSM